MRKKGVYPRTAVRLHKYFFLLFGGVLFLLAPMTTTLARPLTQPEMNFSNELNHILDIQIPGWDRKTNPCVKPNFKDDDLEGITADVSFQSMGRNIMIYLSYPNKKEAERLIINYFNKISKENAQKMKIKGFDAAIVTPPMNQYESYIPKLYINVANRFLIEIMGEEIMDSETLVKAANMIDLKKLATLPK
jgi:hypothetical protein